MTRRKKPARYNVNESLKRCFSYPGNMSAQGMKVSASFWSRRTKKWTKIYEVSVVVASDLLLLLTDLLTDWCCCICRRRCWRRSVARLSRRGRTRGHSGVKCIQTNRELRLGIRDPSRVQLDSGGQHPSTGPATKASCDISLRVLMSVSR